MVTPSYPKAPSSSPISIGFVVHAITFDSAHCPARTAALRAASFAERPLSSGTECNDSVSTNTAIHETALSQYSFLGKDLETRRVSAGYSGSLRMSVETITRNLRLSKTFVTWSRMLSPQRRTTAPGTCAGEGRCGCWSTRASGEIIRPGWLSLPALQNARRFGS